jgi:hypothetical protein
VVLFLNKGGLRVDIKKTEGLFNKNARLKGYA